MTKAAAKGRVGTNLTTGPILKTLLIFAVPMVLTNLVQQLYSMVDVAVVGRFVGNVGTVGVGVGGELADLITPAAMGFSTAGQILIAQLVGANDNDRAKRTVGTLLTFMLGLSVVLTAAAFVFYAPLLEILQCPEEAWGQARSYMLITALGFPFIFGYNAVVGVLRGMGESKRPLIFICVAASINVVADLLLVAIIPLQAAGSAIATVASQAGSFLAAFYYMYKRKEDFDFELKLSYLKIDWDLLKVIVKLGIPQVVRSMLVRVGQLWVNANANSFGAVVSGTNVVGNKLQKFLEVFVQGIDGASAAMIGQNLGARQYDRARKTTLYTYASATVCAAFSAALCLLMPHQIFRIFTTNPDVVELGATFLRIFTIHFFASAFTGSFQSMVTGCGFVELGFLIGVMDGLVCKIGLSWLFMNVFGMGYLGLWWGVACSRILPGCISLFYFLSGRWKTRKLLTEKK